MIRFVLKLIVSTFVCLRALENLTLELFMLKYSKFLLMMFCT